MHSVCSVKGVAFVSAMYQHMHCWIDYLLIIIDFEYCRCIYIYIVLNESDCTIIVYYYMRSTFNILIFKLTLLHEMSPDCAVHGHG